MKQDADNHYSLTELAKAAGVSRQAYYQWLHRPISVKDRQDQEILSLIQQIEAQNKDSVGYDKMTRLICKSNQLGYPVNKKRVIRIMKSHGIKADYRQPRRKRGQERKQYKAANLLKR